jgi:hypothetical protein
MELTELEKKHAFSSDFFVSLMLYPNKYSTLNEEYKRVKECYSNVDSEEEKQIIRLKLQWLHDALLVIEKAEKQNFHNRRYETLEIPNVIPTPTEKKFTSAEEIKEMLEKGMNELECFFEGEVTIAPPTVFMDFENGVKFNRIKQTNEMLSRRLDSIGKYFEGKANK